MPGNDLPEQPLPLNNHHMELQLTNVQVIINIPYISTILKMLVQILNISKQREVE